MEKNIDFCCTSTEPCVHSRRCFMTGEYCSKQPNIQRERKKLHDNKNKEETFKIRAFVIMNFSDMADVVYKWRIRPFIESLSKYLYVEKEKLYCSTVERNDSDKPSIEIEVVRSDSDPASNYVICSRICQQMQIADLVVVDVSNQNANVFYEFGMAVALEKMILPICYSESFYKKISPKTFLENRENQLISEQEMTDIEHHIGFYPWRKNLFEYYGIRYRTSCSQTMYLDYTVATKSLYEFSDRQYYLFPYHEVLPLQENEAGKNSQNNTTSIGQQIYENLQKEYNNKGSEANTLIVYTMDAFLNEEEAGRCIVNFYNKIVSKMKKENCFRGERVGVLVQGNVIPETEKDAEEDLDIEYSVGEIIQIGTNQATYLATEEKIKSDDSWSDSLEYEPDRIPTDTLTSSQKQGIERFVKKHITNRAMRIYPNNPVFVDRMKNLLHRDLLNQSGEGDFYLYYVMLRTLRYTNEIVVDISTNCLQSLFWLGAAHGSDIYAITVTHEKTPTEKQYDAQKSIKENRYIFDVAGLWTAILRKNDTEGFYMQLAAAQSGIERHSKLMLPNIKYYKNQLKDYLFSFHEIPSDERCDPNSLDQQKKDEENEILESYYRDRFWAPMLSYNQLSLYLSHINAQGIDNNEPRLFMSKWDFFAVSLLSHYLSKRKLIGEYSLISLAKDETDHKAETRNFICIGSEVNPLGESLPEIIYRKIKDVYPSFENVERINIIHERTLLLDNFVCDAPEKSKIFKGFFKKSDGEFDRSGIFTHHPATKTCAKCPNLSKNFSGDNIHIFYGSNELSAASPCQFNSGKHVEIAQLILWRDISSESNLGNYFRVGIIGCSGPATSALSVLFIDEEETKTLPVEHEGQTVTGTNDEENKTLWKKENLLCELQRFAREKFMEIFLKQLHKMLMEEIKEFEKAPENIDEQKEKYYALVRYAVVFYLKTVLYRYFFPFLSETDIERIYNGMYTFINSMKAARISPFSLNYHANGGQSVVKDDDIDKIANSIPNLPRDTLNRFRGLEAFYKVEVKHSLDDPAIEKDTRKIEKIELLKKNGEEQINYLFI